MDFKLGDRIQGEIIDFTHEGNGVLKLNNLTIFVKGGLMGDQVEAEIETIKKNFAIAKLNKILSPSDHRIKLDYPLEESRGSVPLIEYDYEKQLEWKRRKVESDLKRIAGLDDLVVKETIGMDDPYGYRNHVQIPVGSKNGKALIGFYQLNSNEVVDMKESILLPEIGNEIISIVRKWMDQYGVRVYDKRNKRDGLRHIGIRINKNNEAMVILVTASNQLPKKDELIKELIKEKVVSIYQNINKSRSSATYGNEYKLLYGQEKLKDYLGNYEFNLSPKSFFQVNRSQAQVLYEKAREYLDLNDQDLVYDLYSGIGTISLYLAQRAKKVYGIEVVKEAVEDAKENARINKIENVEFLAGKTEEVFPKLLKEGVKANKLVLDPPRKGCDKEVLDAIEELSPERIVYVSCNPSTMARDVKVLVEAGYKVVEVQPVDMFPHTAHVESIILMTYCGSKEK